MRITLITLTLLLLPFTAFLQKTGTLVLSGDADYYGYDKSEFTVYYNDEPIGNFDKDGSFDYSEGQKVPLIIKHPDFEPVIVNELSFSRKKSYQSVYENLGLSGKKKFEDELEKEQLETCTESNKKDLLKSLKDSTLIIDSEAYFQGDSAGTNHANLYKYISQNLNYPQKCIEHGIEGKVFISFIVEADGSITCIEIIKGTDYLMDRESLRLVKSLPKFVPAKSNGIAVPIVYVLPLTFRMS